MKTKIRLGMLIFFVLLLGFNKVKAENNFDVQIIPITESEVYNKDFESEVEIIFSNENLYNEQVYLSYHIFNQNNELLVPENQRVPINLDSNGKSRVKLNITLNDIKELKNEKILYITYDLVDEKNQYWFSTDKDIRFDTFSILYEYNNLKRIQMSLKLEILNNPIIFVINILCCIGAVTAYYIIKKREIL